MIPAAVHRSPGIYLTARRPSMKGVRPVTASNGVLSLEMRSVRSMGRKGEGMKDRKDDWEGIYMDIS